MTYLEVQLSGCFPPVNCTRQFQRDPEDSTQHKTHRVDRSGWGPWASHCTWQTCPRYDVCAGNGVRAQAETQTCKHGGEGVTDKGQHTPTYKEGKSSERLGIKVSSRVGLGYPHIRRKAEELNESSETLGWWSGTSVDTPVQWGTCAPGFCP